MRQKSVSSELVMIDDVRQQLSRFGVEKGKIEVPVCYGGAREREREREREMKFVILDKGKRNSGKVVKI